MKLLRRLRRAQGGFSLIELLTVTAILGIVLTGVTTVFVSASNNELRTNRRVQAQLEAGAAFDRLRRDIHCASSGSVSGSTLSLSGCATGAATWQACGYGSWYALYRNATSCPTNNNAANCSSFPTPTSGKLYASCLTSATFTYTASVAGTSLAKVRADIVVNVKPGSLDSYELADEIVLRNSTRT
jgi:prepilin-type N-terminal cleavage/methylation domain-containing protein